MCSCSGVVGEMRPSRDFRQVFGAPSRRGGGCRAAGRKPRAIAYVAKPESALKPPSVGSLSKRRPLITNPLRNAHPTRCPETYSRGARPRPDRDILVQTLRVRSDCRPGTSEPIMTTSVKNKGSQGLRKTNPPMTASNIIDPPNVMNLELGRTRIKLLNGASASHPPAIKSSIPTTRAVKLSPKINAATPRETNAAAEPQTAILATHARSIGADMPRSLTYSTNGLRTSSHSLPSQVFYHSR